MTALRAESPTTTIGRVSLGYSRSQHRKNEYRKNKFKQVFHKTPFETSEQLTTLLELFDYNATQAVDALNYYQTLPNPSAFCTSLAGWALLNLGRYREAAEILLKAQSEGVECGGMLSAALRNIQQTRPAWRIVNTQISSDTHAVHKTFYHRERAFFLGNQGRFDLAEQELIQARNTAMSDVHARVLIAGIEHIRANIHFLQGDDIKALEAVDDGLQWVSSVRRPQLLARKILTEMNLGLFEQAFKTFNDL